MLKKTNEKGNINEKFADTMDMMKKKCERAYADIRIKISRFSKKQLLTMGGSVVAVGIIAAAVTMGVGHMPEQAKAPEQATAAKAAPVEVSGWVVQIDGKNVLRVASEEDAWAVFNGVKDYYVTDGAKVVDVAFRQGIELRDAAKLPKDKEGVSTGADFEIMPVDDAVKYLITGSKEQITYQVQGGDTVWDIAVDHGMDPYELQEMNPNLSADKLSIGQELNLYNLKPFVTVVTTEVVTEVQQIAYTTKYEETGDLYKGQTSVKEAGAYGSKEVTSQLVKENGYIIGETTLSETVTVEPKAQVALKGTQSTPVYTGGAGGTIGSPVGSILVTSKYGSSRSGGRRHMGVDLNCPKGTPFWAADDGVVVFSGWSGTYGNLIRVDNGNGVETRYAHCDSMSVSVGDTVAKGQVMGTVGRTGNATGYVLHFEVLVNGVNKNPMDYL